jgi:TRAP-type mannitol/chloroaromatic compound transport system permease small subunit
MESWIRVVDSLNKSIGHAFSWCVLVLAASTCFEVFMRYVLGAPTVWAFDISYMMYGALFMMSGAYALSRGSHVRGDFAYRSWSPKTQARVDLILYIFFFFPGVFAMVYTGSQYSFQSASILEASVNSPAGIPVWPLKLMIPLTGLTLAIGGIAEVMRCIICIRTGEWMSREGDVEELELVLQQQFGNKDPE